ncbi:MAG: 50S ribosomal protein L22 [Bdellovibrionia bacterium]|jgi:large subunit ribosomal protein L22
MEAKVSFIRITPRKMGLLADEVRGKNINEALAYLQFSPRKRTAQVLYKLLKSAVANADQKGGVDVDRLMVKTILVGQGTTLKRFRPRAKGSAFKINKKTSHVTVQLGQR